jgi:hypothetical protein
MRQTTSPRRGSLLALSAAAPLNERRDAGPRRLPQDNDAAPQVCRRRQLRNDGNRRRAVTSPLRHARLVAVRRAKLYVSSPLAPARAAAAGGCASRKPELFG